MPIALLDERDKAELQEQISNSANAIKNTVSGSAIALTDISPSAHILGVKARSENLIPPLTTLKKNGVTISKENDYYVLNGTCTKSAPVVVGSVALDGDTYTLSANNPQHASNNNALIQIYSASANISFATANNIINGVATSYLPQADDYEVRIRIVQDFVYDNFIIKPKLQKGKIATPYTPYVDMSTASVKRYGKNLLSYPYSHTTRTQNNIDFTDNGDGSITINTNGLEASASTAFRLHYTTDYITLPKGTYVVSGGINSNIFIQVLNVDDGTKFDKDAGQGAILTLEEETNIRANIEVKSGAVVDNVTVYPQIQLGTMKTGWESYKEYTTHSINEDETVDGVISLYPTTTIIPDKYGIILDVEYNADINETVNRIISDANDFSTIDDIFLNQGSVLTKDTLGVNSVLENPNTYLSMSNDYKSNSTTDYLGISDFRICKSGDKLSYKLSNQVDKPILATYDRQFNIVNVVLGQGQSTYLEGEYIFAESEFYFRICACTQETYRSKYYINYKSIYDVADTTVGVLPEYYADYMAERITAVNNKDCLIGNHGDSFVFITDTHTPRNKMNSPALIREVINKSSVKFVINGGDTLDAHETWDEAIGLLRDWRNLMQGITEYRVLGNHDRNTQGNENARISPDDWYGTMVKPFDDKVTTDGNYYFCVDNESQKIRYICLSYLNGAEAERTWFKQRLTELEAGWTVLVIPHYLFGSEAGVIHANGQYVIDDINEVYTTMNAALIGILAGHTHADYSTTEATNGYHLIATTCDTFTGTPTKTAGTVTEQAFDVVHIDTKNKKVYATRIGAGDDREWSY